MNINLERYSQRALQIFQAALQFAEYMGHGFLGSEHLLWALSKDKGSVGKILRNFGMTSICGGMTVMRRRAEAPGQSRFRKKRRRCWRLPRDART